MNRAGVSRTAHLACLLAGLTMGLLTGLAARALAEDESYARVVVESAALRSGPGPAFRMIQSAERDDTFRVRGRARAGYWLAVELSDGSTAYVQGDAVFVFDPNGEEASEVPHYRVFAPPMLPNARGELAVTLGVLETSGLIAVRPNVMLAPSFGFEANLGASVGEGGRLFLLGAGGLVNLFPSWPITPFFTVGGGAVHAAPNSDAFIFKAGTRSMVYAGGGLRFGFRHHLILRAEARNYAMFNPDELVSQQEISGGLSAFF